MAVNRINNRPKSRHDRRIPRIDETAQHLACRVDRHAIEDDEPDAASRSLLVMGDMVIGRHAVEMAKGGKVGLKHHTIPKPGAANREWLSRFG